MFLKIGVLPEMFVGSTKDNSNKYLFQEEQNPSKENYSKNFLLCICPSDVSFFARLQRDAGGEGGDLPWVSAANGVRHDKLLSIRRV